MACSRFEYVKAFERYDKLLPGCWAVIRLDGRSFTSFAKRHGFAKPNDARALRLCNAAAGEVLRKFDGHVAFAFGESDEYSFVLRRESALFLRREQKILSTMASLFTAAYVWLWPRFLRGCALLEAPSFDARVVLHPTTKHLRDYLAWRQADVHVNNLYNTAFWALVHRGGLSNVQAEARLKGTLAKDKHEILFSQFGINYNDEHPMFRKGSFLVRESEQDDAGGGEAAADDAARMRKRNDDSGADGRAETTGAVRGVEQGDDGDEAQAAFNGIAVLHVDIISDKFWTEHPELLGPSDLEPPRIRKL